jgi:zinc-ribbon domain
MNCPRCGAQNAATARFCANCAQPLVPQAVAVPQNAGMQPVPDPNTAFVLEFVLGIFGFMGIGWVYGRRTTVGLVMLVGWWLVVATGIGGSLASGGFGCCLWLPVHFVAPFISAILVRSELEKNPWG